MKNNLKFSFFVLSIIAFTSCSTIKVNYYGNKVNDVQSVTLVSTMIGKVQQPIFPLIDAGIFNEKTNSIADKIMDVEKKNINNYQSIVAGSLKRNYNCPVIFGDSLQNLEGYSQLKSTFNKKRNLSIESNHFPFIITAEDDIYPFSFEKGNVLAYFKTPENYKAITSEIAKTVGTDLFAVSYSTLAVGSIGYFGIYGSLYLATYLYIFDKEGNLVADASSISKPTSVSGKKIDEYLNQLDNISIILDPMIQKLLGK